MNERIQDWLIRIFVVVVGIVPILAVLGAAYWIGKGPGAEITLPLLVVGGVLVLLIVLAMISVLYAIMGLANKDQALALPDGSVRAVLALSLVLLFAIVAIFLYNNVSDGGKIETIQNLNVQQAADFSAKISHDQILLIQPPLPVPPQTAPSDARFTIFFRNAHNPAGDDLAKQLIVMLGTLVTAVASFYFGANSVSSATSAALQKGQPAPVPAGVAPPTLNRGGGPQQLTISGTNLNQVSAVKLTRNGAASLDATVTTTSPTRVLCTVAIDANCLQGPWSVVVSDGINSPVALQNAVTIT